MVVLQEGQAVEEGRLPSSPTHFLHARGLGRDRWVPRRDVNGVLGDVNQDVHDPVHTRRGRPPTPVFQVGHLPRLDGEVEGCTDLVGLVLSPPVMSSSLDPLGERDTPGGTRTWVLSVWTPREGGTPGGVRTWVLSGWTPRGVRVHLVGRGRGSCLSTFLDSPVGVD